MLVDNAELPEDAVVDFSEMEDTAVPSDDAVNADDGTEATEVIEAIEAIEAAETVISSPTESVVASPGTADSPYRRCACLGVLPGRACPWCFNHHWIRKCPDCGSLGMKFINSRSNYQPRKVRCDNCAGRGWVPARLDEVLEVQRLADAAMLAQQSQFTTAQLRANEISAALQRPRGAKLPGQQTRTTRQDRSRRIG